MSYDSTIDTAEHRQRVCQLLGGIARRLSERAVAHDASKLMEVEKPVFDEFTPKLKASTYGSPEYMGFLDQMKPALDHHYEANSHHPEHYDKGILGMSLLDLIEMLADWKAAGERHADGNMLNSLERNQERFQISDELADILWNTARELRWIE
jgi:hypothetical protein